MEAAAVLWGGGGAYMGVDDAVWAVAAHVRRLPLPVELLRGGHAGDGRDALHGLLPRARLLQLQGVLFRQLPQVHQVECLLLHLHSGARMHGGPPRRVPPGGHPPSEQATQYTLMHVNAHRSAAARRPLDCRRLRGGACKRSGVAGHSVHNHTASKNAVVRCRTAPATRRSSGAGCAGQ